MSCTMFEAALSFAILGASDPMSIDQDITVSQTAYLGPDVTDDVEYPYITHYYSVRLPLVAYEIIDMPIFGTLS